MSYTEAKEKYAALGIDTEAALEKLKAVPISLHCWQGDDVRGFDTDPSKPLTGGIQTTGSYPGRARTPQELMADIEEVLKLCPGTKKLNLHASYAIFDDGEWVDRDKLEPKHFAPWAEFCKKHGLGADFNPTFFSHPKCDPLTLSSPSEETRRFWIEHGKACVRISQYLAEELGQTCTMNIWTGDGFKDIPADRLGPRMRYKESIDEILSEPFDFSRVKPCVESKVFGIGVESYTAGSAEFALSYAAVNRDKCIPLMDNGHYHPTEVVSDKIPALLTFFPEIALHITRPVRWDSDHVVLFDDETKEKYIPYVIEPSLGADRVTLAFLCAAYDEENIGTEEKPDIRTVLHFHPQLAPVKIGVLPLSKKLNEGAEKIYAELSKYYNCEFDDRGNIGKRYRRQDEIGTPFCVTYDFDSVEDGAVTVRDRDTMEQERIKIEDLDAYFEKKFAW